MERDLLQDAKDIVDARFEGYLNPNNPCEDCGKLKSIGNIKRCSDKNGQPLRAQHLKFCAYHEEKDLSLDNIGFLDIEQ